MIKNIIKTVLVLGALGVYAPSFAADTADATTPEVTLATEQEEQGDNTSSDAEETTQGSEIKDSLIQPTQPSVKR